MDCIMYITDKTGKIGWRTHCAYGYHAGEQRNLTRHLNLIASKNWAYSRCGWDAESVRLVIEVGEQKVEIPGDVNTPPISDVELLQSLGAEPSAAERAAKLLHH